MSPRLTTVAVFAAAAVPLSMLAFQVDPLTAAVNTAPGVVVAVAGATDTEQTFSVPERRR